MPHPLHIPVLMSSLAAATEVSASPLPSLEEVKKRPTVIIVVGMAGSGKTTFLTRLHREISSGIICRSDENKVGKGENGEGKSERR